MKKSAFALLCAACATTGGAASTSSDPRAAVGKLVQDQNGAIERVDVDAWHAHHATDVIWFGDEADDTLAGKDAVTKLLKGFFAPVQQAHGSVKTQSSPRITVSADGHAAWVTDEDFKLLVTVQGKTDTIPFRHSELLVDRGGQWQVVMEDWSRPIPDAEAATLAQNGKLPTPKALDDSIGAGAQDLVSAADSWLATPQKLADLIANRDDATIIGSAPGEKLEGAAAIKKEFGSIPNPAPFTLERTGGVHAGVAGSVGWAAFVMSTKLKDGTPMAFRVQQVWVNENGAWHIAQMHVSHATPAMSAQ